MTKLTYLVGGIEIASYTEAIKLSKELKSKIVRRYSPVLEKCNVNAKTREKRVAAIKAKNQKESLA